MKKIAFVTNSIYTYGGEQRIVCILANELSKNNDITIFTEDNKNNNQKPFNINTKIHVIFFKPFKAGIFIKGLRLILKFPIFNKLRNFSFTWKITHYNYLITNRLKRKLNTFDTIIAVAAFPSTLLGIAKKRGLIPKVIAWEHSSFESYFRTKNSYLWKQDSIFTEAAKYFSQCVVLNNDYVEKYKNFLNVNSITIYNPRSFISNIKAQLNNKIILTCCRLELNTKGLDLLIESFSIFSNLNPDWKLQIAGDGPDRELIEKLIIEKNLQNKIEILGFVSDMIQTYLNASIYVLSSRWEGFPMTLTEACECGLPLIFFDIPATIPFQNDNIALTAKSFDVKDLANKMHILSNDYMLRKKLGRNAATFSNKNLSIENFLDKWNSII